MVAVTGSAGNVIEHRVYQAIASACSGVHRLPALIGGALLALSGCAETAPALGRSALGATPNAPLARVTFTSRRSRSVDLDDRLPLFDRVGFSWPSAILHDRVHDVYWV